MIMISTKRQALASIYAASLLMCSACAPEQELASDPRTTILVNAERLAEYVDDPELVILHVGDSADYAAEHIPGAFHITRDQVSRPPSDDPNALVLELPEPGSLELLLESFGISNDSRIVVYWGSEWVSPATRVVLTLDWAGLGDRTVLLDGGIEAWKRAGQPVTGVLPTATHGTLSITPRPELIVDVESVREFSTQPGFALVDARSHEYFSGEREGRVKTGHIPGAGSTHWMEMMDDSLRFKSADDLRRVFSNAGVESGDTVVGYCHIGQYATVALVAARTLGHTVRLYDGSFQDWAARDLPVETGDTAATGG
jgi:thiosulfate/3-mercaptopyruvate sulfurtransferase